LDTYIEQQQFMDQENLDLLTVLGLKIEKKFTALLDWK